MSLSRNIATFLETSETSLSELEAVLSKHKLQSLLPEILRFLLRGQKIRQEKETVIIESPFPLSEDSLSVIKKLVKGKDVEHRVVINGDLLAGFKAKYKDRQYDGSAERIIKQFTKHY
jgi:F0F1-type ATP synthase delta subunit